MFRSSKKILLPAAAVASLAFGGATIAGAATGSGSGSSTSGSSTSGSRSTTDRPGRPNETALTGDTATKVKEAALAKVPGTVLRVETDEGGVYEAHIRKSDGTEVEVKVDKAFAVTAVDEHGGRGGRHGGGGPGGGETALTGDTAAKAKAAALAKVPGTVLRVETDRGGVYEAHIRKSDGTEVEVKVDKAFAVTAVEDHQRP
jgi:uncharacterized membrane protein YkoI